MKSNYKKIGKFVQQVKNKNSDNNLTVEHLRGINITKEFMPSVANVTGTDLSVYKVVKKNQFAYNPMHVGRDEILPISILEHEDKVIVSPAYVVFEIVNTNELLPEYLMVWCRRSEFDRNAWFTTDSSVRGGFNWEDFCDLELPVPSKEKQNEIVKEYHTITDRIKLNEQLNQKLEDTAQSIYKEWFVNFEFPDKNGIPYKSNGGEMVYNEELEMEIPKGWKDVRLDDLAKITAGGDKPLIVSEIQSDKFSIPIYANSTVNEGLYGFTDNPKIMEKSITVSARGAIIGYTLLRLTPFVPIVRLIVVTPRKIEQLSYLYECIKNFRFNNEASAQGQLTVPDISSFKIIKPQTYLLEQFQNISSKTVKNIEIIKKEQLSLYELKVILLSKMATIEG